MTKFHGREAVQIENDRIRVTVLREGGHIAEVLHKESGISPLWIPPWPSIEPSKYDSAADVTYGANSESKLLAGIMGHNLCLDVFGPPSPDEFAAGVTVHGESSVVPYRIQNSELELEAEVELPLANLRFKRNITLRPGSEVVEVSESVDNLYATDRPIAWTEHVTIGPPFLERGVTQIHFRPQKSRTFEGDFGSSDLASATDFEWPRPPKIDGSTVDLSVLHDQPSSRYTAHLLNSSGSDASFSIYSRSLGLSFGYRWRLADFPWLGLWEENLCRTGEPWGGKTLALGLEFGVSPFPETRKQMIQRGTLFGTPAYRWLPAKSTAKITYQISLTSQAAKLRLVNTGE